MKGDFSRWSFNPARHFSTVLMQQGRVMLDADHNEQTAIFLHALRTLTRDLFGPHGGPSASGFGLALAPAKQGSGRALWISPGHYYVDGLLCECEAPGCTYDAQPDQPPLDAALLSWLANPSAGMKFWLYLDVWERHISWIEDDSIRDVALGGPDTCTRSKVVWQLKALPWSSQWDTDPCAAPLAALQRAVPTLAARLDRGLLPVDPCVITPDSRYRGAENQLYRVEVHRGGHVGDAEPPTFKWSRDNGSVATPWLETQGEDLIVAHARGFTGAIWVELGDDDDDLEGRPGVLVRVSTVSGDRLHIDPATIVGGGLPQPQPDRHPRVRRWDQTGNDVITLDHGAIPIVEGDVAGEWGVLLEDGVQVRFGGGDTAEFRTGDYWLIPARVATGSIEWPAADNGDPQPLAPFGIEHHYAPLGTVALDNAGKEPAVTQVCRRCIDPLQGHECKPPDPTAFALASPAPGGPSLTAAPGDAVASSARKQIKASGVPGARRSPPAGRG